MSRQLRVLLWNVNNKRECITHALQTGVDLIGVQEYSKAGKHPPSGRMAGYEVFFSGRAALYVNNRRQPCSYEVDLAIKDAVILTLYNTTYICAYSMPHGLEIGDSPLPAIARRPQPRSTLLFGDFNLKHPEWDALDRRSTRVEELLQAKSQPSRAPSATLHQHANDCEIPHPQWLP